MDLKFILILNVHKSALQVDQFSIELDNEKLTILEYILYIVYTEVYNNKEATIATILSKILCPKSRDFRPSQLSHNYRTKRQIIYKKGKRKSRKCSVSQSQLHDFVETASTARRARAPSLSNDENRLRSRTEIEVRNQANRKEKRRERKKKQKKTPVANRPRCSKVMNASTSGRWDLCVASDGWRGTVIKPRVRRFETPSRRPS